MNVNDFVVLNDDYNDIVKNSVGVIENISTNGGYKIFLIGKQIELIVSSENVTFLDITKTGKGFEYKICNVCHILKNDFVDFGINQTDAKGGKTTRPSCRDCRVNIDGAKLPLSERKRMEKIKPVKFFVCPICEKGSIPYITANFVIDHNHNTGMAREWICDSCNTGIGRFKEDIKILKKVIQYLERYNQNN